MKCQHCGTENPPEATFCFHCGKPFPKPIVCHYCGRTTPRGEYCIHCRSKLNDEAKHRLSFLSFLSICFGGANILVSLVFLFFIAAELSLIAPNAQSAIGPTYDIFYFFGPAYEGLAGLEEAAGYALFGPLLGTIVTAIPMLIVILSALTTFGEIRNIKSGRAKGISKPAAFTYFSYLAAMALFLLAVGESSSSSAGGIAYRFAYLLNATTIVGIALGAVLLLASVVLEAFASKEEIDFGPLLAHLFSGSAIVGFGISVLVMIGDGLIGLEGASGTSSAGILALGEAFYSQALMAVQLGGEALSELNANLAYALATVVLSLLFFLAYARTVSLFLGGLTSDKKNKAASWGLAAGIFAVGYGALGIALGVSFGSSLQSGSVNFLTPALIAVSGVGMLIASTVLLSFSRRAAKE